MRQPIPFGKYLLLERISVGGMAEVFKAKSFGVEGFEKIIAIKRILPTMVEDADFIQMFIDEAKIAGQLSHANICQIFELGKIAESHFIAMEFIWGKDLLQIQNRFRKLRQPMPVAMAAFVAARMCEGLDYAHKKKDARGAPLMVVHRDVSPQNILVSYEGEIKLIDFGIAKAATRQSKTQAGVLKGKFGYMSPEQVRGLPLDRRSDLFAVGTILYEMLTGERLFLGESDFSTLERVRNVDISPPSRHNHAVPAALEKIVMKSLAKEAEDRYQWANELQEDLLQFCMGLQPVFTSKQLAAWMKEGFGPELARERQLLEQYKKLGRDGIIAGKAAAENRISVEAGLGKPGPADDGAESTALGGPSFEDVLDDAPTGALEDSVRVAAMSAAFSASGKTPAPIAARQSHGGVQGFGDEGPTEIFGEVDARPQTEPPPIAAESTVILPGGSSALMAVPPPPPRPLGAGSPAVGALAVQNGSASSSPRNSPPGGMPLAAPPSSSVPGMPSPFVMPAGLPASLAPGPAFTGAMGSLPPGTSLSPSPFGASAAVDGHHTAAVPKMPFPLAPARRTLVRDIGIGVGVAVLVLGLIVGGRFLFGGGQRPVAAAAPPTGTIVIAAIDNGAGEVWVNSQVRGALVAGAEPLTLDGLEGGSYTVVVRREGVPDCVNKVQLDVRRPEVVTCRFGPAVAAHGTLVLELATDGVTVLVDNQEISAEAANAPLELAPRVEHTITIQREGHVTQSLQVVLAEGEQQSRRIELVAIEDGRRNEREAGADEREKRRPREREAKVTTEGRRAVETDGISMARRVVSGGSAKAPGGELRLSSSDVKKPKDSGTGGGRAKATPKGPTGSGGSDAPQAAVADVGYLIANTTPYAKVLIDDQDTGKMTPVAPRAKIPLEPGKHTVTFVVGDESFNYPIMIEAGRDHRLIKTLPVE